MIKKRGRGANASDSNWIYMGWTNIEKKIKLEASFPERDGEREDAPLQYFAIERAEAA